MSNRSRFEKQLHWNGLEISLKNYSRSESNVSSSSQAASLSYSDLALSLASRGTKNTPIVDSRKGQHE